MNFSLGSPSRLANLNSTAASEGTATFVITDSGAGKNLVQRITATIASAPSGITAYVAAGATCSGISSTSDFVDKRPSDSSRSQTFCVRVISSATAVSGNVTLNVAGAQQPAGWGVATKTVTIPATINASATPVTPTLTCGTRNGNDQPVVWTAISGETYQAEVSTTSATAGFGPATSATSPFLVTMGTNNTTKWVRVKAFVGSSGSSYSNVIKVAQGNGASSITCGAP
jgi:hypothetical protein